MALYRVTDFELTQVANAIREKGGTSGELEFPDGFVDAIEDISTGTDISDTTATAGDVLSGKYFHTADGTKTQGTIADKSSSDVSVTDNVVTIPSGHYVAQVQKTVGTTQSAQTITHTTTDQTIASGKYLTGAQTIKGDANLVAGNIKKDVQIFGVTGTHEGGGGGYEFFYNGTISFPSYFEDLSIVSLASYAFAQRKIVSAYLQSCATIGPYAFYTCTSFTTASFPECSNIESGAFYGCTSLVSLYFTGLSYVNLKSVTALSNTPMAGTGSGKIYVPSSMVDTYKTMSRWSNYSSHFVGI